MGVFDGGPVMSSEKDRASERAGAAEKDGAGENDGPYWLAQMIRCIQVTSRRSKL